MAKFTVDTHLFRELGELLVGRDSTALIELIKNSYDADANVVTVNGIRLDDVGAGSITIVDDGSGMTPQEFEDGFLRVASRLKEEGGRKSDRYGRRYTGAKGIGRLAAHKLACLIEVDSIPLKRARQSQPEGIHAVIDWDIVESYKTLDDLATTDAIQLTPIPSLSSEHHGSTITLKRLRRKWTSAERFRFVAEVQSFRPPALLTDPPKQVVKTPLLFENATVSDVAKSGEQFEVNLEGEFAPGDEYWEAFSQAADWVLEIDTAKDRKRIHYRVTPTLKLISSYPDAKQQTLSTERTNSEIPSFQARILIREGQIPGSKNFKSWASNLGGIRIFLEGFRVLPYGERSNDWLSLDAIYTGRTRKLTWLENESLLSELSDDEEGLSGLPNRNYFGAVFLTQSGAPLLRLLVNREGFVPDSSFDLLVSTVKTGIDLSTRVRAATTYESRRQRRNQRAEVHGVQNKKQIRTKLEFEKAIEGAKSLVGEARQLAAKGDISSAQRKISDAATEFEHISTTSKELITEGSMLRVLASVGTQMAAFIHEINSLLGMADGVEKALSRISVDPTLPRNSRQELVRLQKSLGDLRRGLERQASYLIDVVTPDARRRRSRQSFSDRFDAGARLVQTIAERRGVTISNQIPPELRSPPMFQAELTTVFSNLITNAVKAAGENGKIRGTGQQLGEGSTRIAIENTGVAVNVDEGERWFKPFESTTTALDPVLGQGMGLGLPITRNMLEQYGADIRFVRPTRGYSTAVEIVFPK